MNDVIDSLHVETSGAGPDIVLLHGWGMNARVWDGVRDSLAHAHRVTTIDLPGHGRSGFDAQASDTDGQARLLLAALPSDCTLLGWSLGGHLALRMATLAPDRVSRLVLVATTPRFARASDWPGALPAEVLDGFAQHLTTDYRRTVADFLELQVRGSQDAEAVRAKLRRALFEHGEATPAALAAGLEIIRHSDLRSLLPAVRQPTLVLAGQYDRITSPTVVQALATALPHATYAEFRRAGHAPFLSHSADFDAALMNFISADEATRARA